MTFSRITGTGGYLPKKILTNDDLSKTVDTSDEWIFTRTGIKERHVAADGETTGDMGAAAAKPALESAGVQAKDIDLILLATTTPDNTFPATACRIQAMLGAGCPAFDLQAVCSGFVYALAAADAFIKSGAYRRVLVIGAETMSRIVDWTDRSTCVLFGDGAGAVVLEASEKPGILSAKLCADGSHFDILKTGAGGKIEMSGQDVFKLASIKMPEISQAAIDAAGLDNHQIDWLIPHQANIRIIDAAMKRLDLSPEKVVKCVEKHANTSSASVPLALDLAVRDGRIKRGQKLLLTAMGGGFTWGAAALEY